MATDEDKAKIILKKANERLKILHKVTGWILEHWDQFPDNIYQLENDKLVPYDVREFLVDLANQDIGNTMTVVTNYQEFLELMRENPEDD